MFDYLWVWLETCVPVEASPDLLCLEQAFKRLPDEDKKKVSDEFLMALAELDSPQIWTLGSLMFGQPLGDDSFKDFRRWLVLQGRQVTSLAFTAPDRLSKVLVNPIGDEGIFIEGVEWLESEASASATARPAISSWATPNLAEMKTLLPDSFNAMSNAYSATPVNMAASESIYVEGMGTLKVGDRIRHRGAFGIGLIRAIAVAETGLAEIEFAGAVKTMHISPTFFERVAE